MQRWSSDLTAHLREVYHRWDSGAMDGDSLIKELDGLGIDLTVKFKLLIEQNQRVRSLTYSAFIRALKDVTPGSDLMVSACGNSRPVSAIEIIGGTRILRELDLASSSRAPYGTDQLGQPREDVRTRVTIQGTAASSSRENHELRQVPVETPVGSGAYRGSSACRELASGISRCPKEPINPITGQSLRADVSTTAPIRAQPPIAGSSSLNTVIPNDTSSINAKSRKHFERPSPANNPLGWSVNSGSMDIPQRHSPRVFVANNILSHDSTATHSGVTVARRRESCPFATTADDLISMRKTYCRMPLGKIVAPITTGKLH